MIMVRVLVWFLCVVNSEIKVQVYSEAWAILVVMLGARVRIRCLARCMERIQLQLEFDSSTDVRAMARFSFKVTVKCV